MPDLKTLGGSGVVFGSLKKNAPTTSPQLSEIRSTFVTDAIAPLVSPTICAPLTTYPKYSSRVPKPLTSMFNNCEVAEYVAVSYTHLTLPTR